MPLIRYFGFVGSALVLLLIGSGWCFPQRPPELPEASGGVPDRPAIRIASADRLPERVIIDTTLPTIVAPPTASAFAERWPPAPVADVNPVTEPAVQEPVGDVPTKRDVARRDRAKKVVAHRAAPKAKIEPARNDKAPTTPVVTRLSLVDIVKEGLGQTQAKLMAALEPLTGQLSNQVSKLRPETR